MSWWAELAAAVAGSVSASKSSGNRGKINWEDITRLMQMNNDFNRVGKQDMFTSWDWDDEKQKITQSIVDPGLQKGFDEYSNFLGNGFERMKLPDQFGSIMDANMANRMQRQGILDETSMPNLKQDNYGTRFGDQYRDSFFGEKGGNSFTGGDGTDPDETVSEDDFFADETYRNSEGASGHGSGGASANNGGGIFTHPGQFNPQPGNSNSSSHYDPNTPNPGEGNGLGGSLSDSTIGIGDTVGGPVLDYFLPGAGMGLEWWANRSINDRAQGRMSPNLNPEWYRDQETGDIDWRGYHEAQGQQGNDGGLLGLGGNQWDQGATMPGYNIQNPGNNSGYYQGGAFNPAAGGGLGGGMGGFGGGFGGSMSGVPVVGGSWRGSPSTGSPITGGAWKDYSPGQNPYLLPLGGDNNTE